MFTCHLKYMFLNKKFFSGNGQTSIFIMILYLHVADTEKWWTTIFVNIYICSSLWLHVFSASRHHPHYHVMLRYLPQVFFSLFLTRVEEFLLSLLYGISQMPIESGFLHGMPRVEKWAADELCGFSVKYLIPPVN